MPYAANGIISSDHFPGAVEVSAAQFQQALEGMCAGMVVTIDGGFSVAFPLPPEPPEEVPPTAEELRASALTKRDYLLAAASLPMAPLQDAVDIGAATPAEEAALLAWKIYRVALSRIDQQVEFPETISWPAPPA